MRASTIMLIAALLFLVHRWATNQHAVDARIIVESAFAILVVAMLDQGRTEEIARGFAWLFLIGAAYTALPSIARAASARPAAAKTPPNTALGPKGTWLA